MNIGKKKLISLMVAGVLLPLQANSAETAEAETIQYIQDFSDYYSGNKWTFIDPELYNPLSMDGEVTEPELFTFDGQIHFSTNWTYSSIETFFPSEFAQIKSDYDVSLKDRAAKTARRLALRDLRERAEALCPVKIEIGKAHIYGIESDQYVAELDGQICRNSELVAGRAGANIRLFSYVPTVPGAKYELEVHYQQRANKPAEDGKLMIKTDTVSANFSLDPVENEELVDGFKVATLPFTAERFFSHIRIKDRSEANGYGALIGKVSVRKVESNSRVPACENYYEKGTEELRNCLVSTDVMPELVGCDLSQAVFKFTPGEGSLSEAHRLYDLRGIPESVLWTPEQGTDERYLTLGKRGRIKLTLKENGAAAACPVNGKVLTLNEVTNGSLTYETWAEKALLNLKFTGCNDVNQNGWVVYEPTTEERFFKTKASLNVNFDELVGEGSGCSLRAIRISDKTHLIPETQQGYQAQNNGVDINGITLGNAE